MDERTCLPAGREARKAELLGTMRNLLYKKRNSGVSLLEVVIAASIISIALVSIVVIFSRFERIALANMNALQATELAEEGVEALKYMRDVSWNKNFPTLAYNQANPTHVYNLNWDGAAWSTTTSATIGNFSRTFTLAVVSRDGSHNVVSSGGSADAGSRKATVSVSWTEGGSTKTKSIETYIFNLFNN